MKRRSVGLLFLVITALSMCRGSVAADPQAALDPAIKKFFAAHCTRCHGEKKAEGDLRVDRLPLDFDHESTFNAWHGVLERVQKGEMPPEKEPRPEAAEVAAVVKAITSKLDEAAAAIKTEGRVVLRRLNRTEYENTVRDLFGIEVEVKGMLPEDATAHGFDNIGSALNVSPVLMERYLEAADAVLNAAVAPVVRMEPKQETHTLHETLPSWFKGTLQKNNHLILFRAESSPTHLAKFRAREAGRYKVRISTFAYQSDVPLTFTVLAGMFNTPNGTARYVGHYDAHPGKPRFTELEVYLPQRHSLKIVAAHLPAIYMKDPDTYPGPGMAIGPIEIEGPFQESWPTASYRRVFGDVDPKTGTLADAEKLLKAFLPRAFRRPTTDDEAKPYIALVAKSLDAGLSFEEALRGGYKAILSSPHLLYFREPTGPLDDHALATRLSYFLWSATPDDELRAIADAGKLRDAQVLHTQVERMLKHPQAAAFTANFSGQWLGQRLIEETAPDRSLYPEFDNVLQYSMSEETRLFFNELLTNDLSLLNFIESDFTFVNDRLAKHYGIPGITGVAMRKLPLKPEYHRGGVLTQASVLKITANGTTTSPVVRGVWVMEHIFGKPVPPPPANVPAIEPDIRGATTIRDQLAKHRQIESCGACHSRIDPAGFALEGYDVIGGYREHYRALGLKERVQLPDSPILKYQQKPGYGWAAKVEAGDVLPDGRKFANVEEFKQLLLAKPDDFARCLTEKLMVYATGSGLEYGDREEIERVVAAVSTKNYGFRSLVHEIAASELFRTK